MLSRDRDQERRVAGVAVAGALAFLPFLLAALAIDAGLLSSRWERLVVGLGVSTVPGAAILGWVRPAIFIDPILRLWGRMRR